MQIIRRYSALPAALRGAVVAIGNFDGVHLGHRGVIGRAAEIGQACGLPLGVLTFEPHPIMVLRPEAAPPRLAPFRTKVRRLKECGVQLLYMLPFSSTFSQKSAEAFVQDVLVDGLKVGHVIVGHDYRFGQGRSGDGAYLVEAGQKHGFDVTEVSAIGNADEIYSSTRVRGYLQNGEVRLAAAILGHMWEIESRVTHGDKRGRELGFPTANIKFGNHVVPAYGIYAVWCGVVTKNGTEWYPAVANVGIRPMFEIQTPILEVHLFGYEGDLYGHYLRVAFFSWIRSEKRFKDVNALIKQMDEDSEVAQFMLAGSKPPIDVGHTPFNQ